MLSTQPRVLKGGIVLLDSESGTDVRALPMLINPAKLRRTFDVKSSGDRTERSAPLRLIGPAAETISLEAKLEIADVLARGGQSSGDHGLRPYLAALQMLITPSSASLLQNAAIERSGALEIIPMEQPLTLFVWGRDRLAPVSVSELSIVEELFNPRLHPISATVTMSLRVLSVDDLGFAGRGSAIYLSHLKRLERSAEEIRHERVSSMGIEGVL